MNKLLALIFFTLLPLTAFSAAKIQNEDVKSLANIQASVLTTTANLSSGNVCITSPGSIVGLRTGLFIYDSTTPSKIPAGTTIAGLPGSCSAGQIQMSASATNNATGDTITFGGQMSQLINDTKVYISALGLNEQLSTAISNGDIGGGGGSGSGYSSIQLLAQKAQGEHFGIFTDPYDNSIESGFNSTPANYQVNGVLLDTILSGNGTIVPVWGPVTLSPTDKNTSTTTGWTTEGNAGSLTTSATTKIGSTSVSFDKTTGGTSATIKFSAAAPNLSAAANTDLWFWVNLPNATGVSDIKVIVDQNGTDFQTCTTNTNYAGASLITGWNLMNFNLATCGTGSGAGWTPANPYQYFHVGIDALSGAAYSGILVNGIMFSLTNPALYTPKGSTLTIYDNLHRERVVISSGNTSVVGGGVTLASNVGHNYAGGFGSSSAILARNTLAIGNNQALLSSTDQFGNSITGDELLAQECRISRALPTALSSATLNGFADVYTSQVYPVVSTSSTTIVVTDTVNQSADLLSGETVHVFRTVADGNGKSSFIKRGDMVLSINSSNAGGQTTLTCSGGGCVPAGTVAGDYVVKKHLTMNYAANAIGANESFAPMTPVAAPNDVQLFDNGLPIPNQSNLYALWTLSGTTTNFFGTGPNLVQTGSPTLNSQFKNNQTSASNWSAGNFFKPVGSFSAISNPAVLAVSYWYYPTTAATLAALDTHSGSNGWASGGTGGGTAFVSQNNAGLLSGGTLIQNQWNHIAFVALGTNTANGCHLWVNGVRVADATGTTSWAQGFDLFVGQNGLSGIPLAAADRLAQVAIWTGQGLSDAQVSQIYNNGLAQVLGFGPSLRYLFQNGGVSGQWIGEEAILQTDTANVRPFIGKTGLTK